MAPITATTIGVARQIIDDPELVTLLKRLHALTVPDVYMTNNGGDEHVVMVDGERRREMESTIENLVKELGGVPRWRFQEQADLYEWIQPLNVIDAALHYFINAYPSLLLIPPQPPVMEETDNNQRTSTNMNTDYQQTSVPPQIISQLTTILTFLSTMLRNATNKSIFHSVHELSSLLTSSDDKIAHLALQCLSTLSQPPLLHRQQAPEMGGHSTQLNVLTDGGRIMRRILACAVGWGSKGSGLGLLNCVEMEDCELPLVKKEGGRSAGSILFESSVTNVGKSKITKMVKAQVLWDDMYERRLQSQHSLMSLQEKPTEKRRKVAPSSDVKTTTSSLHLKSTSQLFYECLDQIHQQLRSDEESNKVTLPPEKQFTLLLQIRLARSFHTSSTRISAIEYRLRAIICLLSSQPNQVTIGAFFAAQPELCSEIVDLIRPTVSEGNIACASKCRDSILLLADSPKVPFHLRTLAIEALTALVARRDSTGSMNTVARQVNVLSELGVCKGQYSGLLPTLIRYSLAALNSSMLSDVQEEVVGKSEQDRIAVGNDMDVGQELGMIFLQCTKPPLSPEKDRAEQALEFIDSVLTLTSAAISVPTGTAALTDCGIIPALVSTVALDSKMAQKKASSSKTSSLFVTNNDEEMESYSECLLKYITAQAIQILEGAIVTHNSALSAFHELKGVDILVQRLNIEMERVKETKIFANEDVTMGDTVKSKRNLQAARRVLLFSTVNCLTVVFHQQEASGSNANIPSGAVHLRKPELLNVLIDILNNANAYGGVLAGLVSTLLSDVINADPQVVHHVHSSGLASSFLSLLLGKNNEMKQVIDDDDVENWGQIEMEPSGELIMAFPNLILALSLTEAGARSIKELNPFPALLSVFCSPKFAMPNSRCLLNEMAAIIGTGLDEIMRHNPTHLKPLVMKAIVQVMRRVICIGKKLTMREEHNATDLDHTDVDLENARTYLVQYSHNISQLLEQILHNEDHVPIFLNEGGVDALVELSKWSITPAGKQFLTHVSCLSSPSIGSVTHTNISASFGAILKNISSHPESHKINKKIVNALEIQFVDLRKCISRLRDHFATETNETKVDEESEFSLNNLLQSIPKVPIYDVEESEQNLMFFDLLAALYRSIISIDWLVKSLATTIRAASTRMGDVGSILVGSNEREIQKELASESFRCTLNQLCMLHRSALWEVCRMRTESSFDERGAARNKSANALHLVYRMRIVCQEGAICRNGIDIDGCDNIGNVEMGEIIEAYDRCINSSGVLRYKTCRGWVSELTRGHGRENIAEIIDVKRGESPIITFDATHAQKSLKRIECGVPDLCSVSACILARLHSSYTDLFSSFERIVVSRIRSSSIRDQFLGTVPPYLVTIISVSAKSFQDDFNFVNSKLVLRGNSDDDVNIPNLSHDAAKCMYLGNILNLFHTCLYYEKRGERRASINIPLLLSILTTDGWKDGVYSCHRNDSYNKETESSPQSYALFSAIHFVLKHSLRDMAIFAVKKKASQEELHSKSHSIEKGVSYHQRLSRAVASSFPPTISLLQTLISRSNIIESTTTTSMEKMKPESIRALISDDANNLPSLTPSFRPNRFARSLHIQLAKVSFEIFSDDRICCAPAHVLFPWISYMKTMISSIEDAAKCSPITSTSNLRNSSGSNRGRRGLALGPSRLMREAGLGGFSALFGLARDEGRISEPPELFQPSEDSIERLTEMGFTRDHAAESLEAVGSNRVDIAMEYALLHPPSSPGTLARRRAAREERRREQLASAQEQLLNSHEESTNEQQEVNESTADGMALSNIASDSNNTRKEDGVLKPEVLSKDELEAKDEEAFEKEDATRAKEYLDSIKEDIPTICLNIIEAGNTTERFQNDMKSVGNLDDGSGGVDADAENVTVVVTSFLVDLCTHFATDVTKISTALIRRLKSNLRVKSRSHCQVKLGCEVNFCTLAHASVIFFRSVPRSRSLILRHGVVSCLLHCVKNITLTSSNQNESSDFVWPCWLAPSLLLLELMAQPTTVSLEHDSEAADSDMGAAKAGKKGDFAKVQAEHKKQTAALTKLTKHTFTVLCKDANISSAKKKKGKHNELKHHSQDQTSESAVHKDTSSKKGNVQALQLPCLPTILPLIHFEDAEASMRLCLQLLGLRSSRKVLDTNQLERVCPPANIVHAALSLLVRVLHFQKIASSCLNMGGADVILSLPSSCHFYGNDNLVTLALRRMLEDEPTLQAMMETEIRSQVTKLYKKQHRGSPTSGQQPTASMKQFMQVITPLVCRAPLIFLKAMACSVKLEPKDNESSSLTNSRDGRVILLTSEERQKNSKLFGPHNAHNGVTNTLSSKKLGSQYQDEQANPRTRGRSKSPHHHTKKEKSDAKKYTQFDGTPQNQITSLLLSRILQRPDENTQAQSKRPFLSLPDYLDILSNLVLAVPSCGAAVHRFKPSVESYVHHALSGCLDPPQTAISYVIHNLVTLPRTTLSLKNDDKLIDETPEERQAVMNTRTSQASARLIVTLVARSGEGRRRVISDLIFAVSCGRIGNQQLLSSNVRPLVSDEAVDEDFEMQKIQTWIELITGLCAPRSSASRSRSSHDANSALSFEVIKVMLEQGAAHATVFAMERINLSRPTAATVVGALIRILEILSRSTVYNKVVEMVEKEGKKKGEITESKESRRMTFGPSNRSESAFADDEMLEDGFDGHNSQREVDREIDNDIVVGGDLGELEDFSERSEDSDSDEDNTDMEIRLGHVDFSDGEEDEEVMSSDSEEEDESDNSDAQEESSEESDDSDSDDGIEVPSEEDEDEVGGDENEDDMFIDGTEQEVQLLEDGWGRRDFGNDELFDEEDGGHFEEPNIEVNEIDDDMGEWTAVDAGMEGVGGGPFVRGDIPGGFADMLMEALQRSSRGAPGRGLGSQHGLQAVENILSNFLREGRMQELEDTLGIRVVRNQDAGRAAIGLRFPAGTNQSVTNDEREQISPTNNFNSVVHVIQSHAPDAGYGGLSITNRSVAETLPMEFLFGGPAAVAGSEYYYIGPSANQDNRTIDTRSTSDIETTELFPGGLASSTHARQSIVTHPLLTRIELPPVNSLTAPSSRAAVSTSRQEAGSSSSSPSSFVRTHSGVIRVATRSPTDLFNPLPTRATASSTLPFGWTDDSLSPETEEFGSLFGQALINTYQTVQEDVMARSVTNLNEESNISQNDDISNNAIQDNNVTNNVSNDTTNIAETEASERNTDSGDAVDVSNLTISQQESALQSTPQISTNQNELPSSNRNGEEDPEIETMAAVDLPADVRSSEAQSELDNNDSRQPIEQNASVDNNSQEEVVALEGGGEENDTGEIEHPEAGETAQEGQLICPPDIDIEVFNSLPLEMRQEICREHAEATNGIAEQIGESSGLDPEALAALPEEMRREIIEQERQQQQRREEENSAAADPSNAEDMDNANFLASLAPDLRQEILLTADEAFLQSLPPNILTEANVLRERVATQQRNRVTESQTRVTPITTNSIRPTDTNASRRRQRIGKLKVETDRPNLVYMPCDIISMGKLLSGDVIKTLFKLFYLLSPIQKQRTFQKLLLNFCRHSDSRSMLMGMFASLLNDDKASVLEKIASADDVTNGKIDGEFPPTSLIGIVPESGAHTSNGRNLQLSRRHETVSAVTAASSIPTSTRTSNNNNIPPIVARRMVSVLLGLTKSSPKISVSMLQKEATDSLSGFERLLDLLNTSLYTKSAKNLEQLLTLLETVAHPLSLLPKDDVEIDLSSERTTPGTEFMKVPRVVVSRDRLHLLVNTLRFESCSEASFAKVNIISRRLSRVEANRDSILGELASVAQGLGAIAIRDLKSVGVRLDSAARLRQDSPKSMSTSEAEEEFAIGAPSSSVSLSGNSSELKLLRVLQTIQSLCNEFEDNVTTEDEIAPDFILLVRTLDLEPLWSKLEECLRLVSIIEGVAHHGDIEENDDQADEDDREGHDPLNENSGKKLQNSVAGLISRFLPAIESFFIVNANSTSLSENSEAPDDENNRLVQFASRNKVLLNALLRSNPHLLEKGLKSMVQIPKCRPFLDFDVKRQWFKTQVRRLRQQANRRHGSLRLNLRRKHVFEDSFRAFIHRNAEELRGRLHITFRNEEGVDAGGLSREFFSILAKEMFNPNYALFMSTEDGCTFQPNPNSSINLDDLNYFRFVGRIVGKAVTDGFLLDAHFTRSLYKHMLGIKPTHHDMQAIDPDYYKNLQLILEHNLEDIGVELTFSTEDHSFGRSQVIDLIPNGRNIIVTDETKANYVDLVCQHRMTTAIEKQIKAYLEGFHEMVDQDLISIFTAKELELLISGMPDIDINDLKKNTDYNGYRPADKEIGWFWSIMFNLSRSEKAAFIQFVTGSSKVPLAGFSELQGMRGVQKFSINKANGSIGALISAHTCFNALDLPVYKSEEEMKEKLLYAISEGGGGFLFA